MSQTIVLAFDIERSGGRCEHDTIAIGASVVDWTFKELDSLFLPGYFKKEHFTPTVFEKRCWEEFWSKHTDILETLKYEGDLDKQSRQREMIDQFQRFREKWETTANDLGYRLELVSDNNVYDGGFLNEMIDKMRPGELLMPYTSSKPQKYKSFWETHSEQRGLLMAVDPSFTKNSGFTKRISELYELPPMMKSHDHNPANDAYTIAYEQQVLLGIRDGKVKRKAI